MMKGFATFDKRVIWRLGIVLSYCWIFCVDMVTSKCTQPEIKSPRPSLQVYQQTTMANVTVYHCQYYEEITCDQEICSNCQIKNSNYNVTAKLTYQYSDITSNCINAFDNRNFIDKYGSIHNMKENFTSVLHRIKCDNNINATKTINITIAKYNTEAKVGQDKITLKSGTVCKYSSRFCHDDKDNIDVIWSTKSDTQFHSNETRRVDVSDVYYFILNEKYYAIAESQGKYFPLRLMENNANCQNKICKTQQEGVVVTEGYIQGGNNTTIETTESLKFYFERKQDMYNFLFESCTVKENNDREYTLFEESFVTTIKLRDHMNSLNEINSEIQRLQYQSEISLYIIVFSMSCLLSLVVLLIYYIVRKRPTIVSGSVPKLTSLQPKEPINAGNAYEYITSEYDINYMYDKKNYRLSTQNNNQYSSIYT